MQDQAATVEVARQPSFLAPLFTDRRIAAGLVLGFSSGLTFPLIYATQSVWLTRAGVPVETVGLLFELTFAYKLKFLWAPFLERYDVPILGSWLGRRRGWILLSQICIAAALTGLAFGDPANWLAWTIAFSLALSVAGAPPGLTLGRGRLAGGANGKLARVSSWAEIGWRVGTLAAGAGALLLADGYGWRVAYLGMAALMLPGAIAAWVAPEPESDRNRADAPTSFVATIWTPIKDLLHRLGPMALPVLVLIAGFRMPGYITMAMANPLFVSLHYSDADIATVVKIYGFGLGIAATFVGGWLVPRIGMMASLLLGTVFGSAAHLALAYLAIHGDHNGGEYWTFAVAVGIESFAYAFASIVLITYMSTLTSDAHAASQYALMTSLVALPGSLLAGFSGFAVKHLGFEWFFVGTSLIGLPVALLCAWVWWKQSRRAAPALA